MDLDTMLAAVGGAAGGYRTFKEDQDKDAQRQQALAYKENELRLREMIAQLNEGGRNSRAADAETGKTTRAAAAESGKNSRADTRDATTRRGQDMTDERYWSGQNPLQWDRDFLTSRGQDVSAANNRRTNATAQRGQDLGDEHFWDTSDRQWDQGQQRIDNAGDNHAVDYALGAYRNELARRRAMRGGPISIFAAPGASTTVTPGATGAVTGPNQQNIPTFQDWLKQTDDPEVFPSVKEMFGVGSRSTAPTAPPPSTTAPAATGAPPRPGRKPAAPVTPKLTPAGAGTSSPEQQAAALIQQITQQEATTGQPATDLRAQLQRLRDQARGR